MNIFNTPDWDSSQIGNENAMQLFKTNVPIKGSKKHKAKHNVKSRKKSLFVTNKFENKKVINKNICTNKISKVDNTQSILSNKSANIKKNLNIQVGKKHRKTGNTSDIQNNTERHRFNEEVKKLAKQKIRRLKRKNKLNKNNDIILSEETSNKTEQYNQKKIKLKRNLNSLTDTNVDNLATSVSKKAKLIDLLSSNVITKRKEPASLKDRMIEKLKASRFRYINEQIYNSEGREAQKYFKNDPDAFNAYHEGYQQQISKWPLNPIDVIIKSIKKMPTDFSIADFGCGEAKLAKSVPQKVYSYDLVAVNDYVTACDMSKVPLENEKINVVVFCLSLMGTNIREYLFEANRVLRNGGILKIAEVESRFDTVEVFIDGVKRFGFVHTWKDLSHNLFYFLDFKKISKCKPLSKLPTIGLHPCLYKKR